MNRRETRRNPFTKEWIIYAESRQFRPDREDGDCPLCVGSEEIPTFSEPLRIPNKFPSLHNDSSSRIKKKKEFFEKTDSYGFCELVVYTDDHNGRFFNLPDSTIQNIFRVWIQATKDYSAKENIEYVLPFENFGEEVGATLHHPHGQIYAFSLMPNLIKQQMQSVLEYQKVNKNCMSCDYLITERNLKKRVVFEDKNIIACIPFFSRYAYDIYIYPKRHVSYLFQTTRIEKESFVKALPKLIKALNSYFHREVSYSLSLIQAPLKMKGKTAFHMFFKLHTPQRNFKSLKILGAVESSLDFFINGTLPETAAENIRKHME